MEYGPARRKCSLGRKSVRARERALRPRGVGGAPACRGGRQGQNFQRGSDRGEPRRAGADDFSSNSGGNFPDTGGKLCPQKSVVMGSTVGPDHRVIRSRGHRLELWEGRSGGAPPWITLRAAQGLEPDAKGRLPGLSVRDQTVGVRVECDMVRSLAWSPRVWSACVVLLTKVVHVDRPDVAEEISTELFGLACGQEAAAETWVARSKGGLPDFVVDPSDERWGRCVKKFFQGNEAVISLPGGYVVLDAVDEQTTGVEGLRAMGSSGGADAGSRSRSRFVWQR